MSGNERVKKKMSQKYERKFQDAYKAVVFLNCFVTELYSFNWAFIDCHSWWKYMNPLETYL